MMTFPTLVEFIEDYGFNELHAMQKDQKDHLEVLGESPSKVTFSEFVNDYYESSKDEWETELNGGKTVLNVPFAAEDDDICLESAKSIMKSIIEKGLRNGEVKRLILEDDMAPHYTSVFDILNSFYDDVVPAVEKALNELKSYEPKIQEIA